MVGVLPVPVVPPHLPLSLPVGGVLVARPHQRTVEVATGNERTHVGVVRENLVVVMVLKMSLGVQIYLPRETSARGREGQGWPSPSSFSY